MEIKTIYNEVHQVLKLTNEDEVLFDPLMSNFKNAFFQKYSIANDEALEKKLDELFEIRKNEVLSTAQQVKVLQSENEGFKVKITTIKDNLLDIQLKIKEFTIKISEQDVLIKNIPDKIIAINSEIKDIETVLLQLKEMNSNHVLELINKKEGLMTDFKDRNSANEKILEDARKSKEKLEVELITLESEQETKNLELTQTNTNLIENEKRIELINLGSDTLEDIEFRNLKELYLFFVGKSIKEVNGKIEKQENTTEQKQWILKNIRKELTNYIPNNWKNKIQNMLTTIVPYPIGIIVKEENSNKNGRGIFGIEIEKSGSFELSHVKSRKNNQEIEFFSHVQANYLLMLKSKIVDCDYIISPKSKFCFSLNNEIMAVISFRKRNELLVRDFPNTCWFAITHKNASNSYSVIQDIEGLQIPHGFYWLTDTDIIEITFQR